MHTKITYLIIGIILGSISVVCINYIVELYNVDWGATANWGLMVVAIIALLFAYVQILENRRINVIEVKHSRKLKRLEITQSYLSEMRRIVVDGTANNAIQKVNDMIVTGNVSHDLDIQVIIYFFEELGIMYKRNMVDRKLIEDNSSTWLPKIYDEFSPFIDACNNIPGNEETFKNWKYLADAVRKKDSTNSN